MRAKQKKKKGIFLIFFYLFFVNSKNKSLVYTNFFIEIKRMLLKK